MKGITMCEDELRKVVLKACDDYLKDAEWKPDILRYFSGYLFFTLLRDNKIPVTEVSANIRLDGLSVLIRHKGTEPINEVEWFYEIKRGGTSFIVTLIGAGIIETAIKKNST
jgi:hypothetical protein